MALAEVIWNGLDANANRVTVRFDRNGLETIDTIRVIDDGNGINYDHAGTLIWYVVYPLLNSRIISVNPATPV
jgi:DNA mismatch repair ATPase MutL